MRTFLAGSRRIGLALMVACHCLKQRVRRTLAAHRGFRAAANGPIPKVCTIRVGTSDLICIKDGRTFALDADGRLSVPRCVAREESRQGGATQLERWRLSRVSEQ
jgi:hypothetical protein